MSLATLLGLADRTPRDPEINFEWPFPLPPGTVVAVERSPHGRTITMCGIGCRSGPVDPVFIAKYVKPTTTTK